VINFLHVHFLFRTKKTIGSNKSKGIKFEFLLVSFRWWWWYSLILLTDPHKEVCYHVYKSIQLLIITNDQITEEIDNDSCTKMKYCILTSKVMYLQAELFWNFSGDLIQVRRSLSQGANEAEKRVKCSCSSTRSQDRNICKLRIKGWGCWSTRFVCVQQH